MRIISGTHKSRQFHIPEHLNIRPTTDFAKEALFNILQNRIDFNDLEVLDLFGGSGSMSYEFASRGCATINVVEKNVKCLGFIIKTARTLGFENIKATKADAFTYLRNCAGEFDLIFADPPFKLENIARIPTLVFENNLLRKNGTLIVEHPSSVNFAELPFPSELRSYGTVNFSIFKHQ